MVLTDDQIKELILHPANESIIRRGCELYRDHIRHVKGVDVEKFLVSQDVKGYENEEEKLLRRKLSRATTVPIFGSALGTFDKAYSASGYSRYFEFNREDKYKTQSKNLQSYLSGDVGDGMSLSAWMQQVWGDKIHYDFNGVFMVELPKVVSGATGTHKPYVIFKSIHDIHDYRVKGMSVEYIILKTKCEHDHEYKENKGVLYFRVVDGKRDLIVRKDGEEITILNTEEYPIIGNIWGYVPAIVASNQRDATTEAHQSFIWESIGTADDYLLDSSIQNISKRKHGFPQKWSYGVPCKQCDSKGKFPIYGEYVNGERPISGYTTCKDCGGSGSIHVSPSMCVLKPLPDANNPDIGEPFGYVVPDIDSIKFQVEEMARLEQVIHEAIWSVVDIRQTETKSDATATGRVLDVSAKQTKLNDFSNNGEQVEQFLTSAIGKAIYPDQFVSSIVKWGRKYYILTENELEHMIKSAKEAGVNASIMKSYMEELIYVRYATDTVELSRQLKLFEAEPFVHMTVEEVQDLKYAADSDKFLKTYFNDYIEQIERTTSVSVLTIDELDAKLKELNKVKMQEAAQNVNTNTPSTP